MKVLGPDVITQMSALQDRLMSRGKTLKCLPSLEAIFDSQLYPRPNWSPINASHYSLSAPTRESLSLSLFQNSKARKRGEVQTVELRQVAETKIVERRVKSSLKKATST